MVFYLEKKVSDLRSWELYLSFIVIQLILGILIALLTSVFDILNIRGSFRALLNQIGRVSNAQPLSSWAQPVTSELAHGKII